MCVGPMIGEIEKVWEIYGSGGIDITNYVCSFGYKKRLSH